VKTFANLIEEILKTRLCTRCGLCVSFCQAINYGALESSEDGLPRYANPEKCVECGLCHLLCPAVAELEEEARRKALWQEPHGNVIGISTARSLDPAVRRDSADGGVVTSLLLRLFDENRIDGAVVARWRGPFRREPLLATTRAEVLAAGRQELVPGRGAEAERYSTYVSSIGALGEQMQRGLRRVAVVGTPLQVKTLRKMQALGVVPTDSIACLLGLFCTGSFEFGAEGRRRLETLGEFAFGDVAGIEVREEVLVTLAGGGERRIPLEETDFLKRFACRFCTDYAAEYADISFGGVGSEPGWSTVVTRTPLGRAMYADALDTVIETRPGQAGQAAAEAAQKRVDALSEWKVSAASPFRTGSRRTGQAAVA